MFLIGAGLPAPFCWWRIRESIFISPGIAARHLSRSNLRCAVKFQRASEWQNSAVDPLLSSRVRTFEAAAYTPQSEPWSAARCGGENRQLGVESTLVCGPRFAASDINGEVRAFLK